MPWGNSLVVQGSGLRTFTAMAWGSIPGQRTKILQASRYRKKKKQNKKTVCTSVGWVPAKRYASDPPTSKATVSAQPPSSQHYSQWSGGRNTPEAINKRMDKNWCGHTMECYSAFRDRKVWHMIQHGCTMRIRPKWNLLVTTGQIPYDSTHMRFSEGPNSERQKAEWFSGAGATGELGAFVYWVQSFSSAGWKKL